MTSERVRTFLGVWAPLILGGLLVAIAVNFFVTATSPSGPFSRWPVEFSWDLWRAVCSAGLVFIAVILGISTLGRVRSSRTRRRAWGRWYRERTEAGAEPPADAPRAPESRPPQGP